MADNVTANPGSGGATFRTDDLGGDTHVPYTKQDLGGDGVHDPLVGFRSVPPNDALATPVRAVGQEVWNVSFADTGASVLSADFTSPVVTGGVTYNQGTSALNVVAGTNVNAEFLTRSTRAWQGSMRLKFGIVASQRIVNNNFAVMLADLIGENLSYTINSSTSVTVTAPGHAFTSLSVGQFVNLAGITGAAGVPGRYAIASVVAGTSITFTVAGWPASGTGTLTLMGHSYVRNLFTGATATNVAFDAQRNGWATGDTTATINTTASPGTVIHNEATGREVVLMDQLRASSGAPNVVTRANRVENIPDDNLNLYVWIWNFNGTVAPASSTTFTLGFVSLEKFANLPVYIQGFRALGNTNAPFVNITGNPNVVGAAAAGSAHSGNPVLMGGSDGTNAQRVRVDGAGNLIAAAVAPLLITDVASAALTTTTTTATLTPSHGNAYQVAIPVTAVTGTTPTLDVGIEESDDGGTNWFRVYDFPRITATGAYRSPVLPWAGNRIRYVQTVGGTTPSFTRAVNRSQIGTSVDPIRQIIDRTLAVNTLNSVTASLNVQNCRNLQCVLTLGAATTPPTIQIEGSDDNGANWYAIGTATAGVASSTVRFAATDVQAQLARARVSSAGTGATLTTLTLKGF
ncbi:MAG: hypothetical protein ING29_13095 [Azospirillum sp.]|nr:hypothetical protein [Azospirillum sp.]